MTGIAVDRDLGAPLHHQIYLVLADGIALVTNTILLAIDRRLRRGSAA